MNQLGWWGCWKNRKEITDWFVAKAKERGIGLRPRDVLSLLISAWAKSRSSE